MTGRIGEDETLGRLAAATPARPVPLGRYDVVGRLGQGGMGTVYDGVDRERGTRVALKTLSAVDGSAALRLKREFRSVADLAHPNLASAYELACVDGLWFFAMEHVDGAGFTRWARGPSRAEQATAPMPRTQPAIDGGAPTQELTGDQPITGAPSTPPATAPARPLPAVRAALAELVRGLAALHAAGLWHGDVKPENVLVRGDGSVVVVDFGLAEPVGGGGRGARGSTGGTPLYMAPEQLGAGQPGPASDWYAVGTMLYEVLTGRLPFDADSLLDLYFQKSHQVPAPPRELVADLPEDLSELCLSLLQAAPERRPSGAELVRMLAGVGELGEPPVRSVFVGRKRELRALEQTYALARGGQAMVVHAVGPSGIGKTAMLRSFTRGVEDVDGAIVLRGRCYERESVPYKAFDGIVDELAERLRGAKATLVGQLVPADGAELAQVFPALAGLVARDAAPPVVEAVELRRRAWAAFVELLDRLAVARPLVLSIDDLQWADADSAGLLATLVADPGRRHQLVVVGYRAAEAEASPILRDYLALAARLERECRLVEIAVGPLPRAEAELLARTALRGLGGAADEVSLRFLADEASGVPLFIEELARFAAAGGVPGRAISLDDAIRARVAALPADQRRLLEVAAVADSPVAQSVAFAAAALDAGALPSLLALRSASLLTWQGAGADDLLGVYHDRIREAVLARLDDGARAVHHLALGRALAAAHAGQPAGPWAFEAVRHQAGGAALAGAGERLDAARLALAAGRAARHAAAFPLAFACHQRGLALAGPDAWTADYELTRDLHAGAVEAAYLCAEWEAMAERARALQAHARTALDQMIAFEVEIDACAGRHQYLAAIAAGRAALALLGVELPPAAGAAEVEAAVEHGLAELMRVGPAALPTLPDADDPEVLAAMRLVVRLSPVAYFGQPALLPILAAQIITTSVRRGLTTATPYALALFGLVLNTVDMLPLAHELGQLAVRLLDRWSDRRLEAATRHVVFNLVTPWMQPLAAILDPLHDVWDLGRRTGDYEYAAYAGHGWVHDCIYVGRPLAPLYDEAVTIGAEMRRLGQLNALHVHQPFEQLLRGLTGRLPHPPRLDDDAFDEEAHVAAAARDGSRSGVFITRLVMGLSRFLLGDPRDAFAHLEVARAHVDAAPSTPHLPVLHQYAALAACARYLEAGAGERAQLDDVIAASLEALGKVAAHAPVNVAHRIELVAAERARVTGDLAAARRHLDAALALARAGDWRLDLAVALELAARHHGGSVDEARAAYRDLGATAKG